MSLSPSLIVTHADPHHVRNIHSHAHHSTPLHSTPRHPLHSHHSNCTQLINYFKDIGCKNKKESFFVLDRAEVAYILSVGPAGARWYPKMSFYCAGLLSLLRKGSIAGMLWSDICQVLTHVQEDGRVRYTVRIVCKNFKKRNNKVSEESNAHRQQAWHADGHISAALSPFGPILDV